MNPFKPTDTWLLYDGECPFCSRYVTLVRLKDSIGNVRLLNARNSGAELDYVRSQNLDIDEGMVLHYDGKLFYGAECINRLALLSTPSTLFNKINALVFKCPVASSVLYPALRAGRNLALKILGRKKING